jgi:hypothetical protein
MLAAYATDNTPGDTSDAMNVRTHHARSLRSLLSLIQSYLDTAHQVTTLSTSACVLNSEINTIADVLGGMWQHLMNMVHQLMLMRKAMREVRARTFSRALPFRYPQHADIVRYDQEAGRMRVYIV